MEKFLKEKGLLNICTISWSRNNRVTHSPFEAQHAFLLAIERDAAVPGVSVHSSLDD
jgi:hypothetical protein